MDHRWVLFAVVLLAAGAKGEASLASGDCTMRTRSDSCVSSCCAWCPAETLQRHQQQQYGALPVSAAAAATGDGDYYVGASPKGACFGRDSAPCGQHAQMRPITDCYIQLGVTLGIVFGLLALLVCACYVRYRCNQMGKRSVHRTVHASADAHKLRSQDKMGDTVEVGRMGDGSIQYAPLDYALIDRRDTVVGAIAVRQQTSTAHDSGRLALAAEQV